MPRADQPDEMDLSREDAQRRTEDGEQPLLCPHCAGQAIVQWLSASNSFPWRVHCRDCHCTTPYVALRGVALALWNRRVGPPTNGLIDKPAADGHTPQRHPRSSGRGSATGKRATGRKGAQSKGVRRK